MSAWSPWRSVWDGRSRAPLRVGLCVIMGLEQLVEAYQVAWQAADPTHYPPSGTLSQALASLPSAAWCIYVMILVGLWLVARDRHPVAAGLWALGWAALLSEWQTQIFGSPSRNAFFPGAALLGWTLGQLWASWSSRPGTTAARSARERLAEAGTLGCIAAAYVGSGVSKLLAAGTSWVDASQIRALILWQQPLAQWGWLTAYRDAIVEDPSLARFAAIATLVIEGGAFLLLLGPRLRLGWAALLCTLHLDIILLCTMPYLEPMALLLLLAVPWPRRGSSPIEDDQPEAHDAPLVPRPMVLVLTSIVLLAWALAPWGWQGQ